MTNRFILRGALVGLVLATVACATHEPRSAFRASVWIGDRGISIPLPPPANSLASVQGEVMGEDAVEPGTIVRLVDLLGEADVHADVAIASRTFALHDVPIDLAANCFEMWVESPAGVQGVHAMFSAALIGEGDDLEVVVTEGCDE